MTIYVTDNGYSYNLVGSKLLEAAPQPSCDEIVSVFSLLSLPLLNLENIDVATYVLSGFVFGKFSTKWIQSRYFCTFLDRLLLTPFRGFIDIYNM